nr:hypothetical protein [Streptomyces poonensis]
MAAAVLLVGGGGAYLAATATGGGSGGGSGPDTSGAAGAPPPLSLDSYAQDTAEGIAPGEPAPNGVIYRADGNLPGGPDSAPVYRAAGEVTAAEVARLAKALGVEGTPRAEGGTWRVGGTKDGSGPNLTVNGQAPGTWTFSRYAPGTDDCGKPDVCAPDTAAGGTPVGEAAAKKAAAPVLKAVGQDTAKLDAGQVMGAVRVVNADPEMDGLPTYGWATGLRIGADGHVVSGSGNLKAPVKGDTYPVVGARKALDLMNGTGRGDVGGSADPVPLEGRAGKPYAAPTAAPTTAPTVAPTVAPEPAPVTVERATFGLAAHHVDGRPALVPSWLFEVRPNGPGRSFTVTHPAVAPEYLAAPERPAPAGDDKSTRLPGKPGADVPGAAPAPREVDIEGYTTSGRNLTVSFWGGVCNKYSASVDEGTGKVTVTATETPSDRVCVLIAETVERTVRLDAPLGDRAVVGSDGRAIPEGDLGDGPPPGK